MHMGCQTLVLNIGFTNCVTHCMYCDIVCIVVEYMLKYDQHIAPNSCWPVVEFLKYEGNVEVFVVPDTFTLTVLILILFFLN